MASQAEEVSGPGRSRRERGVLAQREYRRRHASKFQTLQDENTRLKLAIAEIDKALAVNGVLSEELKAALEHARDIAGLPVPAAAAATPAVKSVPASDGEGRGSWSAGNLLENLNFDLDLDLPESVANDPAFWASTMPGNSTASQTPYCPVTETFAGCIFWRALNYELSVFDYGDYPDRVTISRTAAEVDAFMSRWGGPAQSHDAIDRLWERRMKFKKHDDRIPQLAARYSLQNSSEDELRRRAREEYEELKGKKFWRTSSEVEAVLISTLTKDEWAKFQSAMNGSGRNKEVELLMELVETMAETYFCVGEGPRWNCIWTHMAIGAWVKKLRTTGDDVKMLRG